MADGSVSHAEPSNGRSRRNFHDVVMNNALVEDGEEEEDDGDFAVRREGEEDEEDDSDEWSDDNVDDLEESDMTDEEELRTRYLRLISNEADEYNDNRSVAESSLLDSTPPSTPSEAGFFSRQPIFRGDKPEPVKKPTGLWPGAPTTFPQFSRLPPELRLRIWELHCPCTRQQRRVIRVINENRPLLVPWSLLARQTRALRQFMRIAPETRAIGLRVVPDELPVEYGVVRFNAETDIVHMDYEDGHLLINAEQRYTSKTREAALLSRLPKFPYAHVRNLAIIDCEIRSREPGAYLDYEYGRSIIEFWTADMVSHQRPQELRSPSMAQSMLQQFPKLDNVYVVERANKRRINAWVGDLRPGNHQQFRIHTKEGDGDWQSDVDYVYCWHEPPPAWLKQRRTAWAARTARKKAEAIAGGFEDRGGDSDGDLGCGSDDETKPSSGSDGKIEGDFDNDVVVNYMSLFRSRGVRFSRMLLFELDQGLDIYYELRRDCGPEGVWPVDSKGEPMQDDPPLLDDDGLDEDEDYSEDEYESSGIDDGELEEPETGEESGSDEVIVGEHGPNDAAPGFSSPEGTPSEGEDGGEGSSRRRNAKRRRVVTDSDDESTGAGEGAVGRDAESDSDDGPRPAKRMTLAERLSKGHEERPRPSVGSDEDDEEEDAGDYGPQRDEDEDEDDDDDEDDDEDEDE